MKGNITLSENLFGGEVTRQTFKEQAYQLIKEAVIYHRFKTGVVYSQEVICQELGISRTPVREALIELQTEGYIQFHRGKGMSVVQLDDTVIKEILEVRLLLESSIAALAAKRATQEDIEAIKACLDEHKRELSSDDNALCYRIDHQFHRLITKAAKNHILEEEISEVLNHYLCFEMQSIYQNKTDASTIWKEHEKIFEAISSRDALMAKNAAEEHLKKAYKRTLGKYWTEEA